MKAEKKPRLATGRAAERADCGQRLRTAHSLSRPYSCFKNISPSRLVDFLWNEADRHLEAAQLAPDRAAHHLHCAYLARRSADLWSGLAMDADQPRGGAL